MDRHSFMISVSSKTYQKFKEKLKNVKVVHNHPWWYKGKF